MKAFYIGCFFCFTIFYNKSLYVGIDFQLITTLLCLKEYNEVLLIKTKLLWEVH